MKVLVIHTGGTIGMVQTAHGLAPKKGIVEDHLFKLLRGNRIQYELDITVADPLIDSSSISPDDWNWITYQISVRYEEYDAFLIIHGTDTLAFTSAALCFALEGLEKPVILTGAMLPLAVQKNDGLRNLADALDAIYFATPGVWVQFAGRWLHGARVYKSHSLAFDAFCSSSPNIPPRRIADNFRRHTYQVFNVPVLTMVPGMSDNVSLTAAERADGIVLRCYGSGTLPNIPALSDALKIAQRRDIPVLAISQCIEGGISLGTYAASTLLQETGAIDGRDSTVEAAYTKLLHVLSSATSERGWKDALNTSLCGEFVG